MVKKIVIITGASGGIGLATAKLFMQNNWMVINISRGVCDVSGVINLAIDLSDHAAQEKLGIEFSKIILDSACISIIHNAAYYQKDTIGSLSATSLRQALEVNVVAPVYINQLLLPYMQDGSSMIYIGSTLSEKAVKNAASYIISKHASVGMMRSTCQDLANMQIHTACICPGFTDTVMLRKHLNNDENIIQQISSKNCFNRLIEPSEIAQLILFSAINPVVNGSVLHANMGQVES